MLNTKGFTLLELLIALAISLGGTALAVQTLATLKPMEELRAESLKLRDSLLKARSMARKTLRCTEVQIHPQEVRLITFETCTPDLSGPLTLERIPFSSNVSLLLAEGGTGSSIVFTPTGGMRSKTATTIRLVSEHHGTDFEYTILPTLGTVSMR